MSEHSAIALRAPGLKYSDWLPVLTIDLEAVSLTQCMTQKEGKEHHFQNKLGHWLDGSANAWPQLEVNPTKGPRGTSAPRPTHLDPFGLLLMPVPANQARFVATNS